MHYPVFVSQIYIIIKITLAVQSNDPVIILSPSAEKLRLTISPWCP